MKKKIQKKSKAKKKKKIKILQKEENKIINYTIFKFKNEFFEFKINYIYPRRRFRRRRRRHRLLLLRESRRTGRSFLSSFGFVSLKKINKKL